MSASARSAGHPTIVAGEIGVLIVNLGTPEGTDYWSIRRYLNEFLSDRRVIETPRAIWLPVLQVILLRRPGIKGRDYSSIWNRERDESPLKTITRSQCEKLAAALNDLGPRIVTDWAMRYGLPPIARAAAGVEGERLRPNSRRPSLSAILRGDDGDRRRRGLRHAENDALAADSADRAALL